MRKFSFYVILPLLLVITFYLSGCSETQNPSNNAETDNHESASSNSEPSVIDNNSATSIPPIELENDSEHGSALASINSIAAGYEHSVALKSDGTVVATGKNEAGECDVSDWNAIVSIYADEDLTIGVQSSGSLFAAGMNSESICELSKTFNMDEIASLTCANGGIVGVKRDGTVIDLGGLPDGTADIVAGWSNIIEVSISNTHIVGLKSDGTVVATGLNKQGQCDVNTWQDIIHITTGIGHTVGLRNDGTVISTILNQRGKPINIKLEGIMDIAASDLIISAIKTDGTAEMMKRDSIIGDYKDWSTPKMIPGWDNMVDISCNSNHIIGLKSDGTVVAIGENDYEQCDIANWSDIMLPDT